jgi:hypothetical protein
MIDHNFDPGLLKFQESRQTVSHSFVQVWAGMTTERCRRVLKSHAEFTNLPDKDQVHILLV